MRTCSLCKKKFSFWNSCIHDNKDYCPDCWKKDYDKIHKGGFKDEEAENKQSEERKKQVQEYKRKCRQCGKRWYSLVNREKEINRDIGCNACVGVGTALNGNLGASTQSARNTDAQTDLLDKLHKCPKCGSTNYFEEIIAYEKK